MAVNTTTYVRSSSRTSAYLDWLQMLTGAALILFMWSHMVLVASVNLGAGVMGTFFSPVSRFLFPLLALE